MLQLSGTRIGESFHRQVATGTEVAQEGVALCYSREGDVAVVGLSDGDNTNFAGVAMSRSTAISRAVAVVSEVVPDGVVEEGGAPEVALNITLQNTPLSGQIRVVGAVTGVIEAGDPSTAVTGMYSISGSTLTFHADQAEEVMTITYAYAPTVAQSIQLTGHGPSVLSANALSVIGVIKQGDVSTDQFDVTADWSTGLAVKTGANGLFTTGSAGVVVPGATILRAPSAGSAFLQISLR